MACHARSLAAKRRIEPVVQLHHRLENVERRARRQRTRNRQRVIERLERQRVHRADLVADCVRDMRDRDVDIALAERARSSAWQDEAHRIFLFFYSNNKPVTKKKL